MLVILINRKLVIVGAYVIAFGFISITIMSVGTGDCYHHGNSPMHGFMSTWET